VYAGNGGQGWGISIEGVGGCDGYGCWTGNAEN